ncbi:hypothetical protein YPC_3909 [Yersinia pestis biovar Medievalis str. Harbin 35]|nr:hypothetical protein YPC_3909 [Yersinia pestis biovar Medievalis str. Harbin 35]
MVALLFGAWSGGRSGLLDRLMALPADSHNTHNYLVGGGGKNKDTIWKACLNCLWRVGPGLEFYK